MAHLLRIDSSIRDDGSFSRSVADTFQRSWTEAHPTGTITVRDLAHDPLPYLTESDTSAGFLPEEQRTEEQRAAVARSAALFDELLAADALLLAVPLYNWGIPASVKSWLDHLFTDARVRNPEPLLAGRPGVLVSARGGAYGPGTPREGWDYAEPYLRRVLADALGFDVYVITPELTLAEVNPALAAFKDHAKVSLADAHSSAGQTARALVSRIAA
jgi:FMN-dependent NADH-azoreductase